MRQDEPVTRGMPSAVPDDGLSTQARRLRPALIVNTGDGKGKSTAAFGTALRGWAQGWSIGVFQFVKSSSWHTGERVAFEALDALHRETGQGGPVSWIADGLGFTWTRRGGDLDAQAEIARATWGHVRELMAAQAHRLYVLDEFTYPLLRGWVDLDEVLAGAGRASRHSARDRHRTARTRGPVRTGHHRHRDDQAQAPLRPGPEGPVGHRMVTMPRLVIAAATSSAGKTTVHHRADGRPDRAGPPGGAQGRPRTSSTRATTRWPLDARAAP